MRRFDASDMPVTQREIASHEWAAALDAQAIRTIAANIANGPVATAARYELVHRSENWDRHGPMPAQVQSALSGADTLMASDGRTYTRDAQAIWRHEDRIAAGNLNRELELTREALLPALAQHAEAMRRVSGRPVLSAEAQDRADMMSTYRSFGVAPNDETIEAVMLAVQRTRQASGIDPLTTAISPRPDAQGRYTIDSPLDHLVRHGDGVIRVAATTTPEDIARARDDIHTRLDVVPALESKDAPGQNRPAGESRGSTATPGEVTASPGQARTRPMDALTHAFADTRHPQHALYMALKKSLPEDTSERRLAQFTAQCHRGGIGASSLASIDIAGDQAVFATAGGWPRVEVDIGRPSPSLEDSARLAQIQTAHAQGAHEEAIRHGPAMHH